MRSIRAAIAGLFALLLIPKAQAVLVADSVSEFSGVQGQGSWYYGYSSGSVTGYDDDAFTQMTAFLTGQTYSDSTGSGSHDYWRVDPWTILWADGGHPTGTNSSTPAVAVRRWLSEVSGTVTISGVLADRDWGFGLTGVDAGIFVDGVSVWSGLINDGSSLNYNFSAILNQNSKVDFVLGSLGNDSQDSTRFTTLIYSTVPEPSSIMLMGLAVTGLGVMRRKQKWA